MGIGGPSDLAKLFREFHFPEPDSDNFEKFLEHSYLDSQMMTTAFLLKEPNEETRINIMT